ncbi:AAA family ATPase [Mycoplasma sp. NEAQ87857]|uniref:deoxynucleoside kinase n=1 Tax=Mycoplasma sp. NEAQ87857 TaxID=2683967 RepID=UPI001315BC19|nr:deoxynucleoside kinase [Mycoplasma sp. NEAQ87857]QGZ97768.1 AAA family ATPase [Mycoplasma sp. NEAQ87857]
MLIGISGMISSGKSELSKKLIKHYGKNALLLQEFSKEDEVFNTMLRWLYERKPNFDITFQTYILEYHLALVEQIRNKFIKKGLNEQSDFLFLDRFAAEHYIFASVNLDHCDQKIKEAYDLLFDKLVTKDDIPEYAIFLDVDFEHFQQRLFKRGREVEIQGWEANKKYFKKLLSVYKDVFIKIANKYQFKYEVIDTNNLTEQEVFKIALEKIEQYKASKQN